MVPHYRDLGSTRLENSLLSTIMGIIILMYVHTSIQDIPCIHKPMSVTAWHCVLSIAFSVCYTRGTYTAASYLMMLERLEIHIKVRSI